MVPSLLTELFLPLALGVIMLGLGLSLTAADFRRVLVVPRAVLIGLGCQVVLLPLVCFGIAKAFGLPPVLAVGLMLLAAAPGGAVANLFSHLAHGDVALNVTLTAVNSVLSLVTLPLVVGLSVSHFLGVHHHIPMQPSKVVTVFLLVIVPIALGMLVRARRSDIAARMGRPVKLLSAVFLLLVIVFAVIKERASLGPAFRAVGLPALVFNLSSLSVGYLVPRALRLEKRQATAIGMEIGIHNGTLAIAVANNVLGNSAMALPAAIYSLIMFFTAAGFGWLVRGSEPA
ncbi:MAG: bile acid:sodium symporter family protein [Myxococcales bacterium]|nr:bile acid:sodium symporter family protein [Myxococcales bacterium]